MRPVSLGMRIPEVPADASRCMSAGVYGGGILVPLEHRKTAEKSQQLSSGRDLYARCDYSCGSPECQPTLLAVNWRALTKGESPDATRFLRYTTNGLSRRGSSAPHMILVPQTSYGRWNESHKGNRTTADKSQQLNNGLRRPSLLRC